MDLARGCRPTDGLRHEVGESRCRHGRKRHPSTNGRRRGNPTVRFTVTLLLQHRPDACLRSGSRRLRFSTRTCIPMILFLSGQAAKKAPAGANWRLQRLLWAAASSEESLVGKECVSTFSTRWSPKNKKK